jgi:hypothetical protein
VVVSLGEVDLSSADELDDEDSDELELIDLVVAEELDERFEWLPVALASAMASGAMRRAPESAIAPAAAIRLRRASLNRVRTPDLPTRCESTKTHVGTIHQRTLDDPFG